MAGSGQSGAGSNKSYDQVSAGIRTRSVRKKTLLFIALLCIKVYFLATDKGDWNS